LSDDWILVAALCATPFVIFGIFEFMAMMRRRRTEALARRPKGRS
jgi:hypothetical protein